MVDLRGRLVYVGKSKCLRNRVLSYFLPHNEEDKAGRIVQSAATIVWETHPTEFAALLQNNISFGDGNHDMTLRACPVDNARFISAWGEVGRTTVHIPST